MIKTIMFDLDGTLLPMDTDRFIQEYMKSITSKIAHIIPPEVFIKNLWEATEAMINNLDPNMTNKEVFESEFFPRLNHSKEQLMGLFDEFYRTDFKKLKNFVIKSSYSREILITAQSRRFEIIIATNPLFPLIAIKERLNWIEAGDINYHLITSYENMHFCKPHIHYYQEILDKISRKPEECLMVGNDIEEDLAARKLGIKTFLVEDYIINRRNVDYYSDYKGKLKDLLSFIKEV
ncbi:MAG: HAD family hydrolase [Firmicutes bacterium]|nr:HAD family hydrolase [Bacillota bacterium]